MPDSWQARLDWIIRTFAGGSVPQFAERVGISDQAARKLLAGGVPNGRTLARISRAFPAVHPDYLLHGTGPRRRSPGPRAADDAIEQIRRVLEAFDAAPPKDKDPWPSGDATPPAAAGAGGEDGGG